jgi:pimeloyl-ACP methyl ester carboxylesterase
MDSLHPENSTIVRSNFGEAAIPAGDPVPPPALPTASQRVAEASWLTRDWRFPVLRIAMRTLSACSSRLAARWIDRIWFNASRTRPRPEARAWLDRCERTELRVHGRRVVAWSRGSGPTVLLVHGWSGHAGQMRALGDALLAQGLRVVTFDAPAHGESGPGRHGGRRTNMLEFADALRVVAARFGPVAGLVAHSGGCTATALALRQGWQGPARMAFVAPFALPSEAIEPFGRALGASGEAIRRFRTRVEKAFARPWTDFDIPALPQLRALPPLLVVHDRDDHEVPFFHGQRLVASWPGARLFATAGQGHRRVLRDPTAVAQVTGLMRDACAGATAASATPADARHELDHAFATCGLEHCRIAPG